MNMQSNTMKNLKKQYRYRIIIFFIFMMLMMVDSVSAHNRGHHRVGWGISFGGGGYPGYYGSGMYGSSMWSPGFYGYRPYGYWDPFFMRPPVYVISPPVTTPVRPPIYVQRQESQPTRPRAGYWHYCQNPAGYYPTVKNCSQGWILVPPRPSELQ